MTHGLDTTFLVAAEVSCHPDHPAVWQRLNEIGSRGDAFALTLAVLAEFIHVVTDPRRFSTPLTMAEALDKAHLWWEADNVECVAPADGTMEWFLDAMRTHRLGRKRVLDTMLAATYRSHGLTSLLTLNSEDFAVFGEFTCIGPAAAP